MDQIDIDGVLSSTFLSRHGGRPLPDIGMGAELHPSTAIADDGLNDDDDDDDVSDAGDEASPGAVWLDQDFERPSARLPTHHQALVGSPFEGRHVTRILIVRAPDRLQLRTVITGSKFIPSTSYLSRKLRYLRTSEGRTEAFRHLEEEARVDVVDGVSQFCRIEVEMDDGVHRALPDGGVLYSNGRRAFLDIKREWTGFRTKDGVRQSALIKLAAASLGWDYERYVLASAGSDERREAIDEIQDARFVNVPEISAGHALSALAKGPMSLGRLSEMLHPTKGRRMAFALMVRRLVDIDHDRKLDARTECRAVPPLPCGMPSIRH